MSELLPDETHRQLPFNEQLPLLVRASARYAIQSSGLQLRPETNADIEQSLVESLYYKEDAQGHGKRFEGDIAGSDQFALRTIYIPNNFWWKIVGTPEAEEAADIPMRHISLDLFYGKRSTQFSLYTAPDMPPTMFEYSLHPEGDSVKDVAYVREEFGEHVLHVLSRSEEILILQAIEQSAPRVDLTTLLGVMELDGPRFTQDEIEQIKLYLAEHEK